MGKARYIFLPLLIFVLAAAPIYCPCSGTVIGFGAVSSHQHAVCCGISSGQAASRSTACTCEMSCAPTHTPMCLDHIFKGVLRVNAGAALNGHISILCFTCLHISPGGVGPAHRFTQATLSPFAPSDTNTLLRQHCALII